MIKPTIEDLKRSGSIVGFIATWKDVKSDSELDWMEAVGAWRSVSAFGEFGTAKITVEGSNDKENVGKLNSNNLGMGLNITQSNEFVEINEVTRFIRPSINDGNEATDLTISIMVIL